MNRRVLVVYHHLPNYRYGVFKALEESVGYEFHFAAGASSRDGSIPVIPPSTFQHQHELGNTWVGPFLWQRGLIPLARKGNWDAVIFLGDFGHVSTWIASLTTRMRQIPTFFWTIGWHSPERGMRKAFRLAFYRIADRLLLYGNTGRELGVEMGYPADRMAVIYNSSTTSEARDETVDAGPPDLDRPTIGAVIRLNPVKRLDLLVEAVAVINRSGAPVEVLILGEGPERDRLQRLAQSLGVPLSMPGAAYDAQTLVEFYKKVSVTVVPSVAGLSVTQSLRYGRPAITHDNMHEQAPECEAIVADRTGSFYDYGSVEDLANVISRWLEHMQTSWQQVAEDCHREIEERWTGSAQRDAIIREVVRLLSLKLHDSTKLEKGIR